SATGRTKRGVTCELGAINAGNSGSVVLTASPVAAAAFCATVGTCPSGNVTGNARSAEPIASTAGTATVSVRPVARLSTVLQGGTGLSPAGPYFPGQTVTFTFHVHNTGPGGEA